jgi:beta-RFAP synthase
VKSHSADSPAALRSVSVRAPARLHLGFLDLNATIGRRFGSIGLAIGSHHTALTVSTAERFELCGLPVSAETKDKLHGLTQQFRDQFSPVIANSKPDVRIEIQSLIPEHAGFGSGTQLALTLGKALSQLYQLDCNTHAIAQALGRGKRSGIGIATFDHGGFVIDGGLKPEQTVPPMLVQQAFPEGWRIVLIMDPHHQGIHGQTEKQAFRDLPPFPLAQSQAICHLTLMQLLPALAERDIDHFGAAITNIQGLIGDHFAPAQGGRYTSPRVAACLHQAQQLGHRGIAQSSWGPTGCVFVSSEQQAQKLIQQLSDYVATSYDADVHPLFISAHADNHGAIIETAAQD